jgi:AcrR family transcriptional regulator
MKRKNPTKLAEQSIVPKQKRAVLTRKELIRAARIVFARDGFEQTRIEEIAARAGKTRGAFYDNFDDKEDVFFAIFEEDILRDKRKFFARLHAAATTDERIETLIDNLVALLRDRQRCLLNLEFKMYVIRHPSKQKRLTALHDAMVLHCVMTELNQLLPEMVALTVTNRAKRKLELTATIDGFALNKLFTPGRIAEEQLRRYLRLTLAQTIFRDKD